MCDILEIMKDRRSTRKFNDKPLSKEILEQIVEAGRWAPTGGNCQTVHFSVITKQEVQENLRRLVQEAFQNMELADDQYISIKNSIKLSKRGNYIYDYSAPVLVVVSNRRGYPNAIADCACALQNMMLAAESLGVGSCWINQLHWLDENPQIREYLATLGISEAETICGAVALGNVDGKQNRKPRTDMKVDFI